MSGPRSTSRFGRQPRGGPFRPDLLALLAASCLVHCSANSQQPSPLETLSGWTADPSRPQIEAGDMRRAGLWNDPCVFKEDDDLYVMYLTTSTAEPYKPPVLPFRAVSKDGLKWRLSPNKPLAKPDGTPFVSLETPSVVKLGRGYHMYFSGIYPEGQVPTMAIGHATSPDGVSWKVDPEPLLSATGNVSDWNGYLVAEPGAVVYKNRVYLYFTAIGARPGGDPPQLQTIGLVTSRNGIEFDSPRIVLGQSASYPPEKGYVGYSTPSAITVDGAFHLFYDVAHFEKGATREWKQVALHHAVSPDGETGFVEDELPLLARESFRWTSGEINSPSALLEDSTLKLWFGGHVEVDELWRLARNGYRGSEFGIGYATIPWSAISPPPEE